MNTATVIGALEESKWIQAISNADKGGLDVKCVEVRIPVPWGVIAGKAWGNKNGLPTLGLHGWLDNAGTFDKLAHLLSKAIYFVSIDLPGHGFSSPYPSGAPCHFVDYGLVVRRIVRHFGWKKYSIIGHSMGAGVGAFYASLFPTEVENLVLLDVAKPLSGDTDEYASKISSAMDSFLTLEGKVNSDPPTYTYVNAVERLIGGTGGSLTEEVAKILLVRGTRQVDKDQYVFTRDIRLRNQVIIHFSHVDCFDIIKSIRCKVLFIRGKNGVNLESTSVVQEALSIYKKNFSLFQSEEVDGNHFLHSNNADETAALINKFFHKRKSCI